MRADWGNSYDLQRIPHDDLLPLINAAPSKCGNFEPAATPGPEGGIPWTWTELPRSAFENGPDWVPVEEAASALASLAAIRSQQNERAPLPAIWPQLAVRVMSARDYNFGW